MDDALRQKLKALKAKARDGGATEAEAMAAAAMAADIMARHGLTTEDLEYEEAQAPLRTKGRGARDTLWGRVGYATNCAAVIDAGWNPVIIFIGRAPGPEIAVYLCHVLDRAIDRAIEDFKAGPTYRRRRTVTTKRQAVADFTTGMVERLTLRLYDLFRGSMSDDAFDAARAVQRQRIPSRTVHQKERSPRFGNASAEGFRAGAKVQIAPGVGGAASGPLQIGSA